MLAQLKSSKKEVPTLFYELSRLCLTFQRNPKMETTAVMLLNSLMEEKEKSSINLKCVSIALLKKCSFSGSEVASLLEPHSNLLLDIIENESDLSLRMLAAEVLPKITSSKGLSQVLSQMKSRILALGSSEDDSLISNTLSNNLLQLLAQKSASDSQRLKESLELLLLIKEGIEKHHLYSLLNLVCRKTELQDSAVQLILENLPRGHGMPGFVFASWYLLGEFGDSLFNSRSEFFSDFEKLMNKARLAPKPLRLMIITALAKLWVKMEIQGSKVNSAASLFKSSASKLLQEFTRHQDLETQSRASQYMFILSSANLSPENKLEIFGNMPCQVQSQQFDVVENQTDLLMEVSPPLDNFLDMNFVQPQETKEFKGDPLDLLSTPIQGETEPKPQIDPGLDLFMNSPTLPQKQFKESQPVKVEADPFGLDLFTNIAKENKKEKFDDMDLLSMGVDVKPSKNCDAKDDNKKNNIDFDFGLL